MLIKQAEILFQAEVLQAPVIKKYNADHGWVISLEGTHKLPPELETARGDIRIFKTLDAAVGMLFEIGFSEIKVLKF